MAENTPVQVGSITGIQITCSCGAVHKGTIDSLAETVISACPRGHRWTVEDEENSSNITAVMRLISILNTMQQRTKQGKQIYTCALETTAEIP